MSGPPVWFLDHCIAGATIRDGLRNNGWSVQTLLETFGAGDIEDEVWLADVAGRGWNVLTKDKNIRHRKNELAAVRQHRARLFVVTSSGLRTEGLLHLLLEHRDTLFSLAQRNQGPFIFRVTRNSVERVQL